MLSTDQNIFNTGSEGQKRMIEYGSLFEELHIIIYTKSGFRIQNLGFNGKNNVFIYPTNSWIKLLYFRDTYKIAKKIFLNSKSYIQNSFVITTQDPFETGFMGYLLKRKFKLPLQIQIHTDFLSPYFWRESFKNKIRVLLGKWLIKKADCIRVVSGRIKKSILSRLNLNSEVQPRILELPIFVDTEKIKNTPIKTDLHKKYPDYDFIILMASRLTKEKNIEMALKALREIINTKTNIRTSDVQNINDNLGTSEAQTLKNQRKLVSILLLIVGDGQERENLEFRIQNLGLENNIKIENWTDDLASYYKTADLFLNTSNYEGYGRAIIEALAADCPVLTTDVGVASEIIEFGKSGIIIKPRDTKALIESILEIIRSRQNYRGRIREGVIKNKTEYLSQYKKTFSFCAFRKK